MMLNEEIMFIFKVSFVVLTIQKFFLLIWTQSLLIFHNIFTLLDLKWNKKWCESKYKNVDNCLEGLQNDKKNKILSVYV
jgi:hypothetical protein